MNEKEHQKKEIPPIDYQAVLERLDGDESFLEELLGMYLEDFPKKLADLQEAVEDQNFDLIFKLGHSLKGTSANLGMAPLKEVSLQLETAGRGKNIEDAEAFLTLLELEFKRLKDYLSEKKEQINQEAPERSDSGDSPSESGSEESRGAEVLAADDSIDNQRIMKALTSHVGIALDTANNGEEALELFRKKRYSLVFLDIQMPEMDGFEILKEMRSIEKESALSPTPIVALTGSVYPEDKKRFRSSGFDDYVEKPLEKNEFFKIINKFLRTAFDTSSPEVVHIDQSIKDLIPGYLKHRKNDIKKMKDALKNRDFSTIESIAHKIKGSGESYGFKKIGQIGKEIEKSAQEGDPEKIDHLLKDFKSYLDNIQQE